MSILYTWFKLLVLFASFLFGLLCLNYPVKVSRYIALWFKFVSGESFERYKKESAHLSDVFELIDKPDEYAIRFPRQIQTIYRTGYVAIFVALTGLCLGLTDIFAGS